MRLWHEAPEATILTVITVIAHHEVIILFDGVCIGLLSVDDKLVPIAIHSISLITRKDIFVDMIVLGRQRYRLPFKWNDRRRQVMMVDKSGRKAKLSPVIFIKAIRQNKRSYLGYFGPLADGIGYVFRHIYTIAAVALLPVEYASGCFNLSRTKPHTITNLHPVHLLDTRKRLSLVTIYVQLFVIDSQGISRHANRSFNIVCFGCYGGNINRVVKDHHIIAFYLFQTGQACPR